MNKFKLYIKKEDGSFFRYGVGSIRHMYILVHDYVQLYGGAEFKIEQCDTK